MIRAEFTQHELELLSDAVTLELYYTDTLCNRALMLMDLQQKLDRLTGEIAAD